MNINTFVKILFLTSLTTLPTGEHAPSILQSSLAANENDAQKLSFSQWKFLRKAPATFQNRIVLVPVVSYKSKVDDIVAADYKDVFQQKIIVSKKTLEALNSSTAQEGNFKSESDIYAFLEKHIDVAGLVRLSELKPGVRAISVNGVYFFEDKKNYLLALYSDNLAESPKTQNDELSRVFTFAQTGVTALTRGLINKITEKKNPLYISEKIAPFLNQFHLTHTSNEVSFTEKCEFTAKTMRFCAPLAYFSILKSCGFGVIELTGNHNIDYNFAAADFTLDLYEKNKMRYYGGGRNLKDARKILYIDVTPETANMPVKKTALIAYNEANVYYQYDLPLAKEKSPGANPFDIEIMREDIAKARKNAQTVIVDFQFAECDAYKPGSNDDCYYPMKNPDQKNVFQTAVDFGADIVVGTQAHQPQIIEKYKTGIIFYGLGNLFFDQTRWEGTRQGMILVHVFFEGRYKNTVAYPTYYDQNMQVYLPTGDKKKELLDIYYQRK